MFNFVVGQNTNVQKKHAVTMKVLVEIKDSKAAFIMELLNSFSYVRTKPITPDKDEIMEGLKESMAQVALHKEGKIKLGSAHDLLNEL